MAAPLCPPSPWHSWFHQSRIWPLITVTRVLWPPRGALSLWFGLCLRTPSLWALSRSAFKTSWQMTRNNKTWSLNFLSIVCSSSWKLSLRSSITMATRWAITSGRCSPSMAGRCSTREALWSWSVRLSSWRLWSQRWAWPSGTRARHPALHCDIQEHKIDLHQSSAELLFLTFFSHCWEGDGPICRVGNGRMVFFPLATQMTKCLRKASWKVL